MKNIVLGIIALLVIGGGAYYFLFMGDSTEVINETDDGTTVDVSDTADTDSDTEPVTTDDMADEDPIAVGPVEQIGQSADGHDLTAYHFGDGDTEILLVGGIHGGYSWNTAMLGYELVDYFEDNSDAVPAGVRVTVIPVMNPDGLDEVVGTTGRFTKAAVPTAEAERIPGRFNSNNVDLNRNFACEWQATGKWQDRDVSGGTAAFSEPESAAIRDYVTANKPTAVVAYYSAAGGVYASNCQNGVLSKTTELTNVYAKASGYPAFEEFDFYEITGDMVNWFAREGIPAISVLLTTHADTEWEKNRKGIEAILATYAE